MSKKGTQNSNFNRGLPVEPSGNLKITSNGHRAYNLLLDCFEGQASNLVDRFRHKNSFLYKMSSLELVSNHLREHFCSDTFSQALELDYRNFKLKSTDKNYRNFLINKHKKFLRIHNLTCLPPSENSNPGNLFNRFKFSLSESTNSQLDFWNKLSDYLSFFANFEQIEKFFCSHQDKC